jgi:hypothetical protein
LKEEQTSLPSSHQGDVSDNTRRVMLCGASSLVLSHRTGWHFRCTFVRTVSRASKKIIPSASNYVGSPQSLESLFSSPLNESSVSFSREHIEGLIRRTNEFAPGLKEYKGEAQLENLEILREWTLILFKIPYREKELLRSSVTCIDNLLHKNLDQRLQRQMGSSATVATSNNSIWRKNPRFFDHVTTAVNAWGRIAREDMSAPEKAEALVFKLQHILRERAEIRYPDVIADIRVADPGIRLSARLYSALIYCWSQATNREAASERALYWFDEMMTDSPLRLKGKVSPKTWNALIRIHVRQRRFHDLDGFVDKYSYLNDGYTYVTLLEGWLNSYSPYGPQRAYQCLQEGIDFCLASQDFPALRQLLFLFLSQQRNNVDAYSCELVLKQMISLQEENPAMKMLETKHFVVAMNSLLQNVNSRGRHMDAVDKINELFQSMMALYEHKGCLQLKPNYRVLVVALAALAKKQDVHSLEQCEVLLSIMEDKLKDVDPEDEVIGNHSYNIVLDLYTRVPDLDDRRERIEKLLERMKDVSQAHRNAAILPDRISYSSLIRAIQQEGAPEYASEIDRIVREEMEGSPHHSVQPDETTYALVLDAYYQCNDSRALGWANNLFDRLKSRPNKCVQPDAVMYTLLMKIHSKHGSVDGSDRVLWTMIGDFEGGNLNCRPTEIEFVSAMTSWERSGREDAPDGSLRLFHEMMAQYENGNAACRPSKTTFGQLMVILAKSNHKAKKAIADRLLATMSRLGIEPDLMILNFYIFVCATTSRHDSTPQDRKASWDAALATFHSLRASKWGSNSHSYNGILHACNNLLDEDALSTKRIDTICKIYSQCLEDGKVDERILTTLKRILPPEKYKNLTGWDGVGDHLGATKESQPECQRNKEKAT